MLDNYYKVETPEGIELPLYPAGIVVRTLAFLIDFSIRALVYLSVLIIPQFISLPLNAGIILIILFLLEWFYPVVFELLNNGATPGKQYLGIKVINEDGTPVNLRNSLIRNLMRAADFLPLFYITGIITMACTASFRRLGDLAAGTLVVYGQQVQSGSVSGEEGVRKIPIRLEIDEQKALVAFAERGGTLSEDRRQELAGLLKNVLVPESEDPVKAIRQMANGLIGRS